MTNPDGQRKRVEDVVEAVVIWFIAVVRKAVTNVYAFKPLNDINCPVRSPARQIPSGAALAGAHAPDIYCRTA